MTDDIETIEGTIEIDEEAVEEAHVLLVDHNTNQVVETTTTDETGHYQFPHRETDENLMVVPWYYDEEGWENDEYAEPQDAFYVDRPVANVMNAEYSAIPDSVVAHGDATQLPTGTISSWPDELDNFDLTDGSGEVISDGINGNRSVRFDGTEALWTKTTITNANRYGFILVREQQEATGSNGFIAGGGYSQNFDLQEDDGGDHYNVFVDGTNVSDDVGSTTTDPEIVELWLDDGTTELIQNGSEVWSGSTATPDLGGYTLSSRGDQDFTIEQDVGEWYLVEDWEEGDRDQLRDDLNDKWEVY